MRMWRLSDEPIKEDEDDDLKVLSDDSPNDLRCDPGLKAQSSRATWNA